MDNIERSLSRIEAGLERFRRRALLAALCPGVPVTHTRSALDSIALPSDSRLEDLYAWRNGTDAQGAASLGDLYLFPGFYLLSIEDAVANYLAFVVDPRWSSGWLPVFANGGGDFYVIDFDDGTRGSMRHFRVDESEHPIEFLSLGSMLGTIAAGFERRVFFVDPGGHLEMDDLAFGSLAAELNPLVAWWAD